MDDKDLRSQLEGLFSDLESPGPTESHAAQEGARPDVARRQLTEPEPTDAALRESESRLRAILDSVQTGILIIDPETHTIVDVNPAAAKLIGAPREQIVGTVCHKHVCPAAEGKCPITDLNQRVDNSERVLLTADGGRRSVIKTVTTVMLGGRAHLLESFIDITERKQAEEALVRERSLLRTLIDNLPDLIYVKDTQSRFLIANQAQTRLLGGTTPDDLLGKTDLDFFPRELAQKYYADEQVILQSGQPQISLEEPTIDPAGNKKWLATTKVPLRDSNGQITGIVGMGRDITERKQTEETLERRAIQLQTAAEVSRAANSILTVDELLPQVVDLVRERFDLYYAGLFLVDETGQWAILRAGTGESGRKMIETGHKLEVGSASMIGWCIANRKARIALDVGKEATRFSNPLLPQTRSEMALPLISRDRVIGAMTIQSSRPVAFTQEDINVLQTMADQMANAIENARLFEQTRAAHQQAEVHLRETQMLQQVIQAASSTLDLERVLDALFNVLTRQMGFTFIVLNLIDESANELRTVRATGLARGMNGLVRPLDQMQNDIVLQVARKGQIEVIDGWDDRFDREVYEREGHAALVRAFVPLLLQEKSIGALEAGYNRQERAVITPEEVRLLGILASQIAVAIENVRLFEVAQRRAAREQLSAAVTTRMRETLDIDTVLQTAIREIGDAMGIAEVEVRLAGDVRNN